MISRRNLVKTAIATGTAASFPAFPQAQPEQAGAQVVRFAASENITNFDPYAATSYSTVNYALAVYDTLFALDSNLTPQPQMVANWGMSDDGKTYTFALRDGLGFHDGTLVTAADCVASIRRWFQTPGGLIVKERASDVSKKDDRTFTIVLKEPLRLLIDQMAEAVNYLLFVMREKEADNPPTSPIATHVGSGPFIFNEALFKPGARLVFDRNKRYVPRNEAPSGLAGGKVAKVDRVTWEIITDKQTALAALQAGEVDFMGSPPATLFPIMQNDPNLVLEDLHKSGDNYILRINWLQKPFDNVKARQALLHLIDQDAFLRVVNPNPIYNRPLTSLFGTSTPYVNNANIGWFKKGGDPEKAKQLFKEAGYSGEKVVILQPTDWLPGSNIAQLLAATLLKIGVNADLAPSTWAGLAERRAKKTAVENDGWSIYPTSAIDLSFGEPLSAAWLTMDGSYYGWPKNDDYESLRAKWSNGTLEDRKALSREMQRIWWDTVGSVPLGQNVQPIARRRTLSGLVSFPALTPLWNMQKV